MKTPTLVLLLMFLLATTTRAADDLTAALQQALFHEEADHDLAAAIKAYQLVVAGADAQRKLAGTSVFRLGECYRKLGQTNDAIAQYHRILNDFTDQTNLVTLSRQSLVGLGVSNASGARSGEASDADERPRYVLETMLAAQQADSAEANVLLQRLSNLNHSELLRVLPTTVPDQLIDTGTASGKIGSLLATLNPQCSHVAVSEFDSPSQAQSKRPDPFESSEV